MPRRRRGRQAPGGRRVLLALLPLLAVAAVVGAVVTAVAHPDPGPPGPVRATVAALEATDLPAVPPGWRAVPHAARIGGRLRHWLVLTPRGAHGPLPVYVVLHGRRMTPTHFAGLTDLEAATGPAVLVYPAGVGRSWNAGGCCGLAHRDGVDDVAFLRTLVADVLGSTPGADRSAVYAVGFSNGGRLTYRLACALPGTFAGIAAVEAVPVAPCARLAPLDVEILAQRDDPLLTVPTDGPRKTVDGYLEPTVGSTVARWRRLDGCAPTPGRARNGRAVIDTWSCAHGTRLRYVVYAGGAHVWPVAPAPAASGLIAAFLRPVATRT